MAAVFAAAGKGGYIDALWPAMDGVGPGIPCLCKDLFGFNDLVDLGFTRLLDVDDIDSG